MNNSIKIVLLTLIFISSIQREAAYSQEQSANDGIIEMFIRVEAQNDSLNAASKILQIYKEPNLNTPFSQTVSREIFIGDATVNTFQIIRLIHLVREAV